MDVNANQQKKSNNLVFCTFLVPGRTLLFTSTRLTLTHFQDICVTHLTKNLRHIQSVSRRLQLIANLHEVQACLARTNRGRNLIHTGCEGNRAHGRHPYIHRNHLHSSPAKKGRTVRRINSARHCVARPLINSGWSNATSFSVMLERPDPARLRQVFPCSGYTAVTRRRKGQRKQKEVTPKIA